MIAFVTLLALSASCSAGSLDLLRSPDRNYLPPTQPEKTYLPPSPTPNNLYIAPSSTPSPSNLYLPPSPSPTPNTRYLPPSPTPNNLYIPPSPTPTPNKVYLPPSPPPTPSPVYLPPSPPPTPNNVYLPPTKPNNVYLPPSSPATPNNVYLPPSKPNNVYLPPSSSGSSFGSSANSYGSSGITTAVFRQQLSSSRPIAIVKQVNENNGDGVYTFSYETEDGTAAEERGQLKNDGAEGTLSAQGSFSFTAPDNVRYTVTYTADENGFQPQGAHLPVPPPIPEAILKALADNAADEARGIVDDGSYKEESSSGYPRAKSATPQADAGYYQRSSVGSSGYQRERPAQGGYQRDAPSRPFSF